MSMQYLSLNGFKKVLEDFALADPNLNSFGFGQLYNANGDPEVKQEYPGMWCNPTRMTAGERTITRGFQILFYDVPFAGGVNERGVTGIVSDCEEFALRLVRFLREKSEIFDIEGVPTITPFSDKFLDDVCGVIMELDIQFNGISSDCDDPNYNFIIKSNIAP